jgi:uncharacterized protein YbjQ (UPF0145 family)
MPLFGSGHDEKAFDFHIDATLPFTSDLSAQEFWLTLDRGYTPVGLVLGNSVFSIGVIRNLLGGWKARFRGDVQEFSQLMYDARRIAIHRMQEEARLLGADGIIGVTIEIKELENVLGRAGEYIEVTAVGTAIKLTSPVKAAATGAATVTMGLAEPSILPKR